MKYDLLAVSHDAGGAELLSSYLRQKRRGYGRLYCVVKGPARKIFLGKGLGRHIIDTRKARELVLNKQLGLVLTSASLVSRLETDFIKLAKTRGITTVVMLEHWINYRYRLKNLPDEVWVVDKLAREIAQRELGREAKIKIKPNFYFKDLKAEYKSIPENKDKRYFNILFLNEPVMKDAGTDKKIKVTEIQKVVRFIGLIKDMGCARPICFKIRQHPMERVSEYSAVLKSGLGSPDFKVALSDSNRNPLIGDIKNADIVIGIRSSALAIASLFKKTISFCDQPPVWLPAYKVKHISPGSSGLRRLLKESL